MNEYILVSYERGMHLAMISRMYYLSSVILDSVNPFLTMLLNLDGSLDSMFLIN